VRPGLKRYTLHYNSQCSECAKLAQWNARLDWLRRFDRTTAPSMLGTPDIGDIHVRDTESGAVSSGAYATQVVFQNIPLLWPLALAMKLPFVFRMAARRKPGCNGQTCAVQ
jgi:hypothetical protein